MNIRAVPRRRDWFRILRDLAAVQPKPISMSQVARLCGRDVKSVQHWASGGDPKDTDARLVLQLYARFCPVQYHEHEKQFKITVEAQWAESQS